MTKGRATLYGAGGGAWFGLLIGLLFSIFATGSGVMVALAWQPGYRRILGSGVRLRGAVRDRR